MKLNNIAKSGVLIVLISLVSCASRKDLAYLQNTDSLGSTISLTSYEPKLQNDDLLSIIVSADQPELTYPFNMPQIQGNYKINENQDGIKTYLIDSYGFIEFPILGKIKLAGLTRSQAITALTELLKEYITTPKINLRILNYKISVLGEVARPGLFTFASERITILDAISQAGDLTIFGKRNNILLIREKDGVRSFTRIDLTQSDFITSEFYYLTQNDIIVVEPNQTRINSSAYGPNIPIIFTAISVVTSLLILFTR